MIEHWVAVVADFRREYGVDLAAELTADGMRWGEFCRLLSGLSAAALWRAVLQHSPRRLSGAAAERWFASLGR